jgi:hypothetical protein
MDRRRADINHIRDMERFGRQRFGSRRIVRCHGRHGPVRDLDAITGIHDIV